MSKVSHRIQVTAEWIAEYAQSIGAPIQTINGLVIAPATMPVIFWQEFNIPWLDRNAFLLHGTQNFTYEAPLTAGMTLDCELSLAKVENKTGRHGAMTLYTHSLVCTCDEVLIVTAETVLILAGEGS
jgi:hypothetical protein